MKKLFIAFCLVTGSFNVFSQTCEQREDKLLSAFGSFSAATLYNTYGVIGGIADGYAHDAYDVQTVNDLLDAQKKLADNLLKVLTDLKNDGALKDKADQDYSVSAIDILKGLKRQVQFFQDYIKNNNRQEKDDYEQQRKKNWKDISKLMGIEE